MPFRVTRIRRYPVKSMGGEELRFVQLDHRGVAGDRWFAVVDEEGHLASGKDSRRFRRHDEVFDFSARTDGFTVHVDGDGQSWMAGDPELDAHLSARMGTPVSLRPEGPVPHHDGSPVSLVGSATLDWCAREWGIDADPRRLRVNVVLQTSEPFAEEAWVGLDLAFGIARLHVTERIPRCRMIDVPQDGAPAGDGWLKYLGRERDMNLGVYARVVTPAAITVGERAKPGAPLM
ncbi:MOSC N-terminal beta barrel domain-containing protein [Luteococcus sp. H138]|uniref:MOSC domain-containing protein n=1 Tax=unclassified Luteococcus TaxID=2639923 RepID=UPI00313F388E